MRCMGRRRIAERKEVMASVRKEGNCWSDRDSFTVCFVWLLFLAFLGLQGELILSSLSSLVLYRLCSCIGPSRGEAMDFMWDGLRMKAV